MSMEQSRDFKFAGKMTIPGGIYRRVACDGEITVDGDIDCQEIRVNGKYNGSASTKAANAIIRGGADFGGDVDSGDFRVYGEATIDGSLTGGNVKAEGRLSVRDGIKADRITAAGQLATRGDCEAESLACDGSLEIEGALNAGDLAIKMYGPCHVKEIGGAKIVVRKGGHSKLGEIAAAIFNPLGYYKAHLVAGTIEGDDVYLEHTTAQVVRGGRVTVGKGCEIDRVEYRIDYRASAGTSVLQNVKI